MKIQYLGIAWYHRKDYKKLLKTFVDSHLLPKAYDIWLKYAEEGIDRLTGDGFTVEKVYIDPESFPTWCRAGGLDVDAIARVMFADDFVARKYLCEAL